MLGPPFGMEVVPYISVPSTDDLPESNIPDEIEELSVDQIGNTNW